jgi:uncharacterized protein (DUF488 family)
MKNKSVRAVDKQMSATGRSIFTIGHSNHTVETFLNLLTDSRIEVVVDVRSAPYSSYSPHFNAENVRKALESREIEYLFLGDVLGGKPQGEGFLDADGCVLYDHVAETSKFQQGIRQLIDRIQTHRVALLCAEEDPTNCHRRLLIGRVLGERGVKLLHIRGDGRVESEEEIAEEERFRKTKGQRNLFGAEEREEWKSTQSVLRKRAHKSSSKRSNKQALSD